MANAGARDVAAQLLECLAVIGSAAHGGVQTETLLVGTQLWSERGITGHGALHREHLLAGAWAKGDAVSTRSWNCLSAYGVGPDETCAGYSGDRLRP